MGKIWANYKRLIYHKSIYLSQISYVQLILKEKKSLRAKFFDITWNYLPIIYSFYQCFGNPNSCQPGGKNVLYMSFISKICPNIKP